jgi:hypothetical protein
MDCLQIKPVYRKGSANPGVLILYYVLMVASAFFLNTEIYSSIYKHSGNN